MIILFRRIRACQAAASGAAAAAGPGLKTTNNPDDYTIDLLLIVAINNKIVLNYFK
jgi:hypothetical protein